MGLGLAIVRRAAKLLGTTISVRSVPGRGSLFHLTQPIAQSDQTPENTTFAELQDPISGLALLIVEDDPDVRTALVTLTSQWGVFADIVGTADEALVRLAEHYNYSVILSDYRLPGSMNGLQLLRHCQAQHAGIALSLITGDLDPVILAEAQAANIPIAHKPLPPARLRALLIHLANKAAGLARQPPAHGAGRSK